jgi:hypothetical protein
MPDDCNDPDRTLPCSECCPGFACGVETKIISAEVFKHGFAEYQSTGCPPKFYLNKTTPFVYEGMVSVSIDPTNGCMQHTWPYPIYGPDSETTYPGDYSIREPVNFGGRQVTITPTSVTVTYETGMEDTPLWVKKDTISNEHTTEQLLSTLESRVQNSLCDFESIEFGQNRKVDFVRLPPNPPILDGRIQPCYEATYEPQCVDAGFNFNGSAHKTLSLDERSASAQKIEYRIVVERPIGYCSKDGPVNVKWRQRTRVSTREDCAMGGDPETTYEDFEESITFPEGEPEDGFLYLYGRSETYSIDVPAEIDTVVDVVGLPARASAGIGLSYKSASITKFGFPAFTQSANAPRFFKKAEVTGQFAGCPQLNIEPRDYGNTFTANSPLYWQLLAIQSERFGFIENVFCPTYYPIFRQFPDGWEQYASEMNLPPLVEETETKRVWKSVIKCGEQDVEHKIEVNLSEEVTSGNLQAELNEYLDSEDTYSSGYFENSATEHDLYISKTNSAELFVSLSIPYAFSDAQSFDAVVRKRTTNTLTGEMSVVQEKFKFDFAAGETYKEQTTDISAPPSNTRIEYKVFEEDQATHNLFTLPGVDVQWARKMNVPINPKTGWEL